MRLLLSLLILFGTMNLSHAQCCGRYDNLQASTLGQTRVSENEEWQNNFQRREGYDIRGNVTESVSEFWDRNRWWINYESRARFNNDNQTVYRFYQSWDREPYRKSYQTEIWLEWDGDLMIGLKSIDKNFIDNQTYNYAIESTYDEQKRITYNYRSEQRNNLPVYERRTRYHYDFNGCSYAYASDYKNESSSDWIQSDSTINRFDDLCNYVGYAIYSSPEENAPLELTFESRLIDRSDSNGNITMRLEEFRQSETDDWDTSFYEFFQYNSDNLITFEERHYYTDIDTYSYRSYLKYDAKNRLIRTDAETKQNGLDWSKDSFWETEYDNNDRQIYSSSGYNWDRDLGDYRSTHEWRIEYGSDGLTRKEYNSSSYYDWQSAEKFYNSSETESTYRCDEALLERVATTTDSNEPNEIGSQNRTIFEYYLEPPCNTANVATSQIRIFPNPSSDYVHIYYPEQFGSSKITITDTSGRIFLEQQRDVSNYFSLDLNGLGAGLYIIKIESEGVSDSQRFVITK